MAQPVEPGPAARVGPNAIIQTALVLRETMGVAAEVAALRDAGLPHYVGCLPDVMIAEREAAQLFATIFRLHPHDRAGHIAALAGSRTGDYILANRIPLMAQRVLRMLPRRLAARLLLGAIARHAWTFAGSGRVTAEVSPRLALAIADNPLAMPGCIWHLEVLGQLFRRLVSPDATVRHTACCGDGAPACRFEVQLTGRSAASPDV